MTKLLAFSAIALCFAAGTARASLTFTLTDPSAPEILSGNVGATHYEQEWNFTTLPLWNASYPIDSITVTEVLTAGIQSPTFGSTIINFTQPTATASGIFTMFPLQAVTGAPLTVDTFTETFTPGVGGFTLADITGSGTVGEFNTRVARNTGVFTLDSMTIAITVETPEPSTIVLMGFGLIGLGWIAWRRRLMLSQSR